MVPAMWLLAGATLLVYGLVPRWSLAAWALVAWVFVAAMFGILLDLPQWMLNLSPFQHVPALPAASMAWPPIVVLTAIAVALIVAGLAALDRRDLARRDGSRQRYLRHGHECRGPGGGQRMSVVRVTGFDHLVLRCADIESTLRWYVDLLGLETVRVDEWRRGRCRSRRCASMTA